MEKTQTPRRAPRRRRNGLVILRRSLLVFFTLIILVVIGLCMVCNLIFNGPSESARDVLTMSMLESSGMKWFPGLFIGQDKVNEIQSNVSETLPNDVSGLFSGSTPIASNPDDFLVYFSDVKVDGVQDLSLVRSESSLVFTGEFSAVGNKKEITCV